MFISNDQHIKAEYIYIYIVISNCMKIYQKYIMDIHENGNYLKYFPHV